MPWKRHSLWLKIARWLVVLSAGWGVPLAAAGHPAARASAARSVSFAGALAPTICPNHAAVRPIAAAIRQVSTDPVEQLSLVQQVTRRWVEYASDRQVYGRSEYYATLDEMLRRRKAAGWSRLRDDCDGRAVFAAHLLAALGLPWQLEGSRWKGHAWVSTRIDGVHYDLLDLQADDPELQSRTYRWVGRFFTAPSRPPPIADLRMMWRERTGEDPGIGAALGLLDPNEQVTPLAIAGQPDQIGPGRRAGSSLPLAAEGRLERPRRRAILR